MNKAETQKAKIDFKPAFSFIMIHINGVTNHRGTQNLLKTSYFSLQKWVLNQQRLSCHERLFSKLVDWKTSKMICKRSLNLNLIWMKLRKIHAEMTEALTWFDKTSPKSFLQQAQFKFKSFKPATHIKRTS